MKTPIPIFRAGQEVFHADSCQPLTEAALRGAVRLEALVHGHYPGRKLADNILPGLKSAGFWDTREQQNWGLPWHRNEGIELCFLESGTLGFATDQSEFILHPDDIVITRPWQRHRVGSPNVTAGRLHWVIIDVKIRRPNQEWRWPSWLVLSTADVAELTHILRHTDRIVWRASAELRRCFESVGQAIQEDEDGSSVSAVTVRLNELLLLLLGLFRRHSIELDESLSSSRRTVELFLEDLREHPEHLALEWSVEQMAASCGLKVTQFVFHVHCLTNMTPRHYLNHCRLDEASRLLLQFPHRNVTDIALSCGFSTSQYFATVFGGRFRCTPREFRRTNAAAAAH